MQARHLISAAVLAACTAGAHAQQAFRIVAIGDSYASGEGASDGSNPATWQSSAEGAPERATDLSCHRSSRAWPRQVADGFRESTGRPVEFTSFACSGAEIPDLIDKPYKGVGQNCNDGVGGQLCEVERRFEGKQIDALLVSIGGNDVGFGPTVTHCVVAPDCGTNPPIVDGATNDIAAGERKLAELYTAFARRIEEINRRGKVTIHNVYLVEYPIPLRDEHGNICNAGRPLPGMPWTRPTLDALDAIGAREAKWAAEVVMPSLNRMVQQGAGMIRDDGGAPYGFFVGGVVERFRQHGYCAENRWINLLRESFARQGDFPGAVHPNIQGQQGYRDAVLPALRALVPPAAPQLVIAAGAAPGTQTALTPAGLRLAWQGNGPETAAIQIASRAADVARSVAPVEQPANPKPDAFALPPRLPRNGDAGWSIATLTGSSAQSTLVAAPAQPRDFAVRACTGAACSPWSRPVRFAAVDGLARRVVEGLRATTPALNAIRATWTTGPAQANTYHQVAYRSSALPGGERIAEVPSGGGQHTLAALPRADFQVAVRECAWTLLSPQERAGQACGPWSAPVAVSLKPAVVRPADRPAGAIVQPVRPHITRPHFDPIR
jgi:hypothetical protein